MTLEERNKFILESSALAAKVAQDALKARDEAQERLLLANQADAAWKTIKQQAGLETAVKSGVSDWAAENATVIVENDLPVETENKAEFVKAVVERSGPKGLTPAEVKQAAQKAGIALYKGYPHSVLFKFKKQGKISVTSGGRYVSAKYAPKHTA